MTFVINGEIVSRDKLNEYNQSINTLVSKLKFINYSTEYIVVSFRDGAMAILPPQTQLHTFDAIIIGHSKSAGLGNINVIDGNEDKITNLLRTQLALENGRRFYWEEEIKLDLLRNSTEGVYVKSSDVILTLADKLKHMDHHPFSSQATYNRYMNMGDGFNPKTDINISIFFIDNVKTISRVYAILNNSVTVITAKKSNTQSNGIYVCGLTQLDTSVSNSERKVEQFTIEEVLSGKCPIRMFETLVEARDYLTNKKSEKIIEDVLERDHQKHLMNIKRELETLKHDNLLLQAKQQEEKQLNEEQRLKREREILDKQNEHDIKLQQAKEEAAINSAKLKLYGDIGKAVVATATTMLALYKIFK